jgi:hypothetical protein
MADNADSLFVPHPAQPLAEWAVESRRRGFGISAAVSSAIIRVRPLALMNLALLLCGASGAGIFLLVAHALTKAA